MPHLIIEYSRESFDDAQVGVLVDCVFEAVVAAIRAQSPAISMVTAEVIEMDRATYSRYSHE